MVLTADKGTVLAEEMLAVAHQLVREGWCQGSPARDACGRPVSPTSAFASSWSAPGALERVWARSEDRFGHKLDAFEHAHLALAAAARDVPQNWNDAEGRRLYEVLDKLAEAMELVGGDSAGISPPALSASGRSPA